MELEPDSRMQCTWNLSRTLSANQPSQADRTMELHQPETNTLTRRIVQQTKPFQPVAPSSCSSLPKPRPPSKDGIRTEPPAAQAPSSTPAMSTAALSLAERHLAKCRQNRMVFQRELAAVAATVPRKKPTAWQTQVQAQGKFRAEAKAHMDALLQAQMPNSTTTTPTDGSPAKSVREGQESTPPQRNRTLRSNLGKEVKAREKALKTEFARKEKAATPQEQMERRRLEIQEEKLRVLEMQRRQRERKNLQRRRVAENLRLMAEEREQLEEMAEQEATAKAFSDIARKVEKLTRKKKRNKNQDKDWEGGESMPAEREGADKTDIFYAGVGVCYRQRINHLEAEMAKCKEQLVNFVQNHQDLLNHNNLRYHFKKLQPRKDSEPEEEEDGKPLPEGSGDPGSQSFERFRREQQKQRQRQLQEFLARDDTNEFDIPDLANVYRASCYLPFNQQAADSGSSSPDSGRRESGSELSQERNEPHHTQHANYFSKYTQLEEARRRQRDQPVHPERNEKTRQLEERLEEHRLRQEQLKAQLKACRKQHEALGLHHKVHHHQATSGPRYDPMRLRESDIQEANFSQVVSGTVLG
ncbi:extracellular signal-regulated kinase 7 isoform X2 [Drosophila biarmipes]|uniref:extracellular signal-regulated kinase 7 isoform X2 n=1 Tax=Drosophila biarmipes TaxID=125945 RepID=UPI0007E7F685|nr:extracellular signal-regulated kinase 7 isoform X2 [Drosophila biarmipes]